eukprot:6214207-Pleurochrysis_carterae.AAC.1
MAAHRNRRGETQQEQQEDDRLHISLSSSEYRNSRRSCATTRVREQVSMEDEGGGGVGVPISEIGEDGAPGSDLPKMGRNDRLTRFTLRMFQIVSAMPLCRVDG